MKNGWEWKAKNTENIRKKDNKKSAYSRLVVHFHNTAMRVIFFYKSYVFAVVIRRNRTRVILFNI